MSGWNFIGTLNSIQWWYVIIARVKEVCGMASTLE